MGVLSSILRYHGVQVTLKHLASAAYNEYDELDEDNCTWTETQTHILLKPFSKDEITEIEEGRLEGCNFQAFYSDSVTPQPKDRVVFSDGRTFEVMWTEQKKAHGDTLIVMYLQEMRGE